MKLHVPNATSDDIDMTPMVDVIFQLIIFFMLASSFVDEAKVFRISLPRGEAPQTISTEQVRRIVVTADGTVAPGTATRLEERYPSMQAMVDDLRAYRQRQQLAGQQSVIVIEGDRDARYQRIIQVWNAIRTAGIEQVSFQVDPGPADDPP